MSAPRAALALSGGAAVVAALAFAPRPLRAPAEPVPSGPSAGRAGFQCGIALSVHDLSLPYAADLRAISECGATHVQIPVHWRQQDVRDAAPRPYDVPDLVAYEGALRRLIVEARERGLAVFLNPILHVERLAPGEWRGTLRPPSWLAWFAGYRDFLLWTARIAAEEQVALLSVGSELLSSEHRTADWRETIQQVRAVYRGPLTYSSNWDHYGTPAFWGRLDFAGLSLYQELVTGKPGYARTLPDAWRYFREPIRSWQRRIGLPLLVTEIGYASQRGAREHPWDYTLRAPLDLFEQQELYAAFFDAFRDEPYLSGAYLWAWEPGRGGLADRTYAFSGKPAESLVRGFFWSRRGGR